MNDDRYNELLNKLSIALNDGSDEFITSKTNVSLLDKNKLLFTHVMVHKLYASGSEHISKAEIVELHNKIKCLFGHKNFDSLDLK